MQLILIASLLFALLIALFAIQNVTPVDVSFLVWRLEGVAVAALVLAAAALGALLTYLLGLARGFRSRRALHGQSSTIRDQDAVIAELRARVQELESQTGSGERESAGAGEREMERTEPVARAVDKPGNLTPSRPGPEA